MHPKSEHFTWRQILDVIEGRSDGGSADSHLDSCATCRTQLAEARELAATLRFAAEFTPTAASVARVLGRLDPYGPELAGEIAWARAEAERLSLPSSSAAESPAAEPLLARLGARVVALLRATLVADSWSTAAAGVRGTSTASPRILVYETPEYAVSLSLHLGADPESLELDVIGQVAPRKGAALPEGVMATLETMDGASVQSAVEPFGEFRFEGLRAQPLRLELQLGHERIEVGPLPELGVR